MQLARQQATRAAQQPGQAALPQLACSMMISPAWQGLRCIRSQTCCLTAPSRCAKTGMPLQQSEKQQRSRGEGFGRQVSSGGLAFTDSSVLHVRLPSGMVMLLMTPKA